MNDEKQIKELAKYMHALDDMNVLTIRLKSCIGAIKRSNSAWAKKHWTQVMRALHDQYLSRHKQAKLLNDNRVLH